MSRLSFLASLAFALVFNPLAPRAEEAPLVGGLEDLTELSGRLVEMTPAAQEATVALSSRGGQGMGSGVIISEDGLVMTAAHVVASLTDQVVVTLADGRSVNAEKLGADFDRDAALVRITEEGPFPFVERGDNAALQRNDWCVAVGHPGGYDQDRGAPLRLGRVLSAGRFVITDCAVVGGDSGGPLFDVEGRVVGIHSNIGRTLSENRHVPIAVFQNQWDELLAGRQRGSRFGRTMRATDPARPVMGVDLGEGGSDGVQVLRVVPGSPAAEAGLQEGDVIVSIGEEPVTRREALIGVVNRHAPGDRIKVVAIRDGEEQTFDVELARLGNLGPQGGGNPAEEEGPEDEEDPPAEQAAGEDAEEDGAGVEAEDLDSFLDRQLEGRAADGGELRLEMTLEQIEEFGGMENVMKRLQEKVLERQQRGAGEPAKPESDSADEDADNQAGDGAAAEDGPAEDAKDSGEGETTEQNEQASGPEDEVEGKDEVSELTDEKLRELIQQAIESGGQLQMQLEDVEKYGGAAEVGRRLAEIAESLSPEERAKLARARVTQPDPFFASTIEALKPVVEKAAGSSAIVLADGEAVALGTFVNQKGWLVTKDTETRAGEIKVRFDGADHAARLIERFPNYDLAVFAVKADGYRPVQWAPEETLRLGALLAVPNGDGEPIGIGMTSVLPRALRGGGFLGVQLGRNAEGVLVDAIVAGSPAAKAELSEGDLIAAVNGSPVADVAEFNARMRELSIGDTVQLEIDRDGERIEASAELGQRPGGRGDRRFQAMNQMSGPLSSRTDGFPMVLQHDIPLTPDLCGGPLLDLEGRCVGINVSRAGRVNTYAIPAATVRELLAGIDQPVITEEDMREVRELIRDLQSQVGELEEKLADLESRAVPAGE